MKLPSFREIAGLHSVLLRNLDFMKLSVMTEIQAKTWEAASQGKDVLGRARTGTGKVCLFVLSSTCVTFSMMFAHHLPIGSDISVFLHLVLQKTISFLLPSLQQLMERKQLSRDTIHMLVLSPTRELAAQIDDEAQKLTKGSNKQGQQHPQITHQVIFGGSSRPKDVSLFERRVPSILVATPGRLRDHLDNTTVGGKPFRNLFHKTSILVLDETDR